ncbi:MAG TPA: helix-turn-helix domain-containing protein [Xanthobacteraceae bacterium]|jgi:hypothetical protein
MAGYLERMLVERAQRLARMNVSAASPGVRGPNAGVPAPGCRCGGPTDETPSLVARIEAIERVLAAGACKPELRPRPQVQISAIKTVIYRYYGLTAADLAERSRSRAVSRARQIAIYLARRLTGKSFRALAQAFGDRNHSSVIRAFQTIERLRLADAETDHDVQGLARELSLQDRPRFSAGG